MRNPITLLCLADLHCEEEKFEYFSSLADAVESYTKQFENSQWRPNYLVVAGDIITAPKENGTKAHIKEKYDQAQKVIDKFIGKFQQLKNNIIIIPGNHDAEIPRDWKQISNNRDIFQKYCGRIKAKGDVKTLFASSFEKQFYHYLEFSKQYKSEATYHSDSSKVSENLSDLAGVRIFEDDNICFVPINTEWLYVPHSKIKNAIKDAIKNKSCFSNILIKDTPNSLPKLLDESVNIVENCSLCSPLIKDAYYSLVELHKNKDYTIVTIMHRGPEYLPYEDKNPTDKANTDSLGIILNLSDILLTGHEHQTRITSQPSCVGNSVLHFKLGSVGRKEKMTSEHVRWASLIHIDPISGSVEHLPIVYDNTQLKWIINAKNISHSLLRNKYENNTTKEECWKFGGTIPVIHVKSNIDDIIEGKIKQYFDISADDKNLTIINSEYVDYRFQDPNFINSIKELAYNNQQMKIVVYYIDTTLTNGGSKIEINQVETMKKIDDLRAYYAEYILLNKLIINEVMIKNKK